MNRGSPIVVLRASRFKFNVVVRLQNKRKLVYQNSASFISCMCYILYYSPNEHKALLIFLLIVQFKVTLNHSLATQKTRAADWMMSLYQRLGSTYPIKVLSTITRLFQVFDKLGIRVMPEGKVTHRGPTPLTHAY